MPLNHYAIFKSYRPIYFSHNANHIRNLKASVWTYQSFTLNHFELFRRPNTALTNAIHITTSRKAAVTRYRTIIHLSVQPHLVRRLRSMLCVFPSGSNMLVN